MAKEEQKRDKEKLLRSIPTYIGQLHKIEDELEEFLELNQLQDLSDSLATVKAYIKTVRKLVKDDLERQRQ